MSAQTVTVALPTRNGEETLEAVLRAVGSQHVEAEIELLVADSGSRDRTVEIARRHGAEVVPVEPSQFSHGGTRNLLMERASGEHVAFLTQDAVPADERWLQRLLAGFAVADDVALVCGPYLPRPGARVSVRRELTEFFESFSADGRPRVDRLGKDEAPPSHPGPITFFSDANGCLARDAWERVPFRRVPYAEDQLLARDMLAAGFAKVFVPDAAVVHSHEYPAPAQFRRFFDEWRGLREVYGWVEPLGVRHTPRRVLREARQDRELLRSEGVRGASLVRGSLDALGYHAVRAAGSALGSRADRLPRRLRAWCSLEGRDSFEPQ